MNEKSRTTLLKLYRFISSHKIPLYVVYVVLFAVYVIKSLILTGSPSILIQSIFLVVLCIAVDALPLYRAKIFRFEYLLELIFFPIFILIMLLLAIIGLITPGDEAFGLIAVAGLYTETVYAIKTVKHETDF